MKPALLLIRLGPETAVRIAGNEAIRERFRLLTVDQQPIDSYEAHQGLFDASFEDRPWDGDPGRTGGYLRGLVRGFGVTHALVSQPLLWYSDVAREALLGEGVSFAWTEAYFGGEIVCDRVGMHYTRDNEIRRYAGMFPASEPRMPSSTRAGQPEKVNPDRILERYGADEGSVCVFGQTPYDMSLVDHVGLPYLEWLDALFRENPWQPFVFKHHPLAATPGIDAYENVTVVDEHVHSLFATFGRFAAYSSTVIFEGVGRRLPFVTGGTHYCSGFNLTLERPGRDGLQEIASALDAFVLDEDVRRKVLHFVTHRYAVDPGSPRMLEKILLDGDAFYGVCR